MKIFGLTIMNERQISDLAQDRMKWGAEFGYREALLDTGFTAYELLQPDPEYSCEFMRYGCKPFIGESALFDPAFNVAGLYWKECK